MKSAGINKANLEEIQQKTQDEIDREKKAELQKEIKKKKRKKKKEGKGADIIGKKHATQHKDERRSEEKDDSIIGYGTNAMIYNKYMNENESSDDEGLEDYKVGGYHSVHVG